MDYLTSSCISYFPSGAPAYVTGRYRYTVDTADIDGTGGTDGTDGTAHTAHIGTVGIGITVLGATLEAGLIGLRDVVVLPTLGSKKDRQEVVRMPSTEDDASPLVMKEDQLGERTACGGGAR